MAQSVVCPALGFSSGHNLWVVGSSPASGSGWGVLCEILSLPLPYSFPIHAHAFSLKSLKRKKSMEEKAEQSVSAVRNT